MFRWVATVLAIIAYLGLEVVASPPVARVTRPVACCSKGGCRCATQYASENFVVQSHSNTFHASEITTACESLRNASQSAWLEPPSEVSWSPQCEVVVHASSSSYVAAVGGEARRTSGCSLIKMDGKQIVLRRIDLLADDKSRALSALAHELTHVVLADRFGERPLPRWADEGIATLADHIGKQNQHHQDMLAALRIGSAFRLGDLLVSEDYPPPVRFAAFYGQSVSLVRFLSQRNGSTAFVKFVERSRQTGYDQALRDVYGIADISELERQWRSYAVSLAAQPVAVGVGSSNTHMAPLLAADEAPSRETLHERN